ncbi:hypothetical protein SUGI_0360620 [Cryptomeria japonica]|nr:hypothetical protein SUGI_0360620 [Cryptomeria japonica]
MVELYPMRSQIIKLKISHAIVGSFGRITTGSARGTRLLSQPETFLLSLKSPLLDYIPGYRNANLVIEVQA